MRGAHPAGRLLRAAAPILLTEFALAGPTAAATFHETPTHLVILTARADGAALRLLLDTGDSGGLSIDATAADRLGLTVRPKASAAGDRRGLFGPLPEPSGTARIERLSVDDAVWESLDAAVIRDDAAFTAAVGAPYDGVIGAGLLAGRRLVVDYPRRTLTFGDARGASPTAAPGAGPALRSISGYLVTDVDLGGGRRTALIDTASAVTFVDSRVAGPLPPTAPGPRGVVDAGGTATGLPRGRSVARLAVGGVILKGVDAFALGDLPGIADLPTADAPLAAVLGADLLARYRVVLDLARGSFALEAERP